MSETPTVFIIGDGEVTSLAGGPIPISDMGTRKTKRVSCVEFNAVTNKWEVLDPVNKDLPPRYADADYDKCLRWETEFFNRLLASNPDSPALKP
jgi:hypothetical protein